MADTIETRLRVEVADARQGGIWVTVADVALEAADEIERLRSERDELWGLLNSIDRAIHKREPINPWWHDRVVLQQSKQWPSLWEQIRRACTDYLKVNPRG